MTDAEIQSALAYNRRQDIDRAELKQIQEVTGSTPDGEWGPRTVRAIAMWQDENGLDGDGKVGPRTFDAIVDYEEPCPGHDSPIEVVQPGEVVVGVWGDDAPRLMASEAYADELVDLGISEVALMMNRANISTAADPWDLRWKDTGAEGWDDDDSIGMIATAYAARNIRLILTAWPQPSKAQIDEMCDAMIPLLRLCRAVAFEVDTEGNWLRKHLQGFGSMDEAAAYLVLKMQWAMEQAGIEDGETESTTFGHHAELGKHPTVTPLVDRACVQGYSTSPRSSGPVAWDSYLGPGRHQAWIIDRAKKAGAKEIVMGLAAYKQSGFKGHTADEALTVAYDRTVSLGIRRVRYWSSKHILGSQRKEYSNSFLRRIRAAA